MNLSEWIGMTVIIFFASVGAVVVGRCAWIGAKQSWGQRERQAQREFETKAGLS